MNSKALRYRLSKKRPDEIIGSKAGFTLAELLVAMGIMAIVVTAIVSLFTSLNRVYTTQGVAAGVQQVTRAGIDIMTRKIRMAGFNPLDVGNIGIVQADPDRIRFSFDYDGDGTIATNGDEDIAYLLNENNQLIQQKNGKSTSNESLVDNVTDLTFRYLDADDLDTNDRDAIRTVEVSLTVEEPAGRDKVLSRTYSTRVICRNLSL
ncbi:MAG: prepilin-type N-terminal cleavage/methylation domain-containing protein [Deltaproteobacteria bacterium]|jgi:type IV pilus assembly protein PilW|nr:prepilin-type N-terminal cleavage/methylation domain-containing protein [Deltaproteobacteria bacterium]